MASILNQLYKFVIGETSRYFDKDIAYSKKAGMYVYKLINFEPDDEEGKLRVCKGLEKVIRVPSNEKIVNFKFSRDDNGVQHLTVVSGNKLYEIFDWDTSPRAELRANDIGDGYVSIIPVTDKDYSGGTYTEYLAILDGGNPRKYDYNSLSSLSTNHNARLGLYVNDRLITNDEDEKALVHWSKAGSIFVPYDNTTHVIIAKRDEMHAIYGTSSTEFGQYELNIGTCGTRSPQGLVQVGQEIFILHDTEIKRYSTLRSQGILKEDALVADIYKFWKDEVNKEQLENGLIIKDNLDKKIYFMCSKDDLNINNSSFVYAGDGKWYERLFNNIGITAWDVDPQTNIVYVGDDSGNVYKFNVGYNYDGQGYRCYIDYGLNDMKTKYSKVGTIDSYLDIEFSDSFSLDLSMIKFNKNGNIINSEIKTLDYNDKRSRYDRSNYDNNYYISVVNERKNIKLGVFDTIQTKIVYNNINSVGFKINELSLNATQGYLS